MLSATFFKIIFIQLAISKFNKYRSTLAFGLFVTSRGVLKQNQYHVKKLKDKSSDGKI